MRRKLAVEECDREAMNGCGKLEMVGVKPLAKID